MDRKRLGGAIILGMYMTAFLGCVDAIGCPRLFVNLMDSSCGPGLRRGSPGSRITKESGS